VYLRGGHHGCVYGVRVSSSTEKVAQGRQTVKNKKHGTLWRIMAKSEAWQPIGDNPETNQPRMVPAMYLSFWRVQEGVLPGVGKMMGFLYTLYDNTFEVNWTIVE